MSPRRIMAVALLLLLAGCALPQKVHQVEQDKARLDRQESQKAAYDRCNQDSMPGTTQHLACRMAAEKSAIPPGK